MLLPVVLRCIDVAGELRAMAFTYTPALTLVPSGLHHRMLHGIWLAHVHRLCGRSSAHSTWRTTASPAYSRSG